MNKINKWIFDDGAKEHTCSSFPYAYKMLYNQLQKAIETGIDPVKIQNRIIIVAPWGKTYNYKNATDLALAQGLLTNEGKLNPKALKENKSV